MNTDREPTDEQLQAAWRALARPEWGSYEEARLAWIHFSIVRSRARVAATGRQPVAEPTPVHTSAPTPAHYGSLRVPHQQPIFDRKRAAAGEREDD